MKIAVINPWAISVKAIGGTERFVMDIAESLQKLGNDVDVYMFSGKSHSENNVNYINLNLFNIDGEADEYFIQNIFGNFEEEKSYRKLAEKLEEKIDVSKYDYIQLNSQLFLEVWKDKRRIFTIHTNPFEYKLAWGEKSYNKMLELMRKSNNNVLTTFVAPSKYYAKMYSDLANCKVRYIPHAIDISRLYTTEAECSIIKKYNLDKDKLNIIVPSRLEPKQKQPMLLIDACSALSSEIKQEIQIIYTGLDKQYIKFVDELKECANKNDLNIKIIRFEKMCEVYKIADLTILPSRSESFGYSALESLSLGIPTFLNCIPTFQEIANGNERAKIFKSKEALTKLIEEFVTNNILKRKKPNDNWKERYTLDSFGNNYLKLMK